MLSSTPPAVSESTERTQPKENNDSEDWPPMTGVLRGGMPTQTLSAGSLWVGTQGFPWCRPTGYCSSQLLWSVSHSLPSLSSKWDVQTSGVLETLMRMWWVHLSSAVLTAVSVVNNTWKGPNHFATSGASFHSLTATKSPGWMLWAVDGFALF